MIPLLWAAQAGLFAAAVAFNWRDTTAHGEARVALAIRIAISGSLVVGAWLVGWLGGASLGYARWAAWGMLCGFIGDLVMARLIPVPNRLLGGMLCFGVGHGFYMAAAVAAADTGQTSVVNAAFCMALAEYTVLNLVIWRRLRGSRVPAAVTIGALLYGLWIGLMAACMVGLAAERGGAWWVAAAGGLSFLVSDLLIGLTEIGTTRIRHAHDWVWSTYLAGQMGIVYAGWLAG